MNNANINLHIERIVLEGAAMAPAHRDQFQQQVSDRLTKLLAAYGVAERLQSSATFQSVLGGVVQRQGGPTATSFGMELAHAVYASFGGSPANPMANGGRR